MARNTKEIRILIAQKDETNRAVLEKQLERWSLPFDSVSNGEDALEHFINHYYDLVLMDVQMPHMDGLEATEQIKTFEEREERDHHIPIIAVTADAVPETAARCRDVGMIDVVVKPYSAYDLRMMIYYYLGNLWKMRLILKERRERER